MTTPKSPKSKSPKRTPKKHILDALSDKLIASVVRGLPKKAKDEMGSLVLGEALKAGEIVFPFTTYFIGRLPASRGSS